LQNTKRVDPEVPHAKLASDIDSVLEVVGEHVPGNSRRERLKSLCCQDRGDGSAPAVTQGKIPSSCPVRDEHSDVRGAARRAYIYDTSWKHGASGVPVETTETRMLLAALLDPASSKVIVGRRVEIGSYFAAADSISVEIHLLV
jgi:hypothetical protein